MMAWALKKRRQKRRQLSTTPREATPLQDVAAEERHGLSITADILIVAKQTAMR